MTASVHDRRDSARTRRRCSCRRDPLGRRGDTNPCAGSASRSQQYATSCGPRGRRSLLRGGSARVSHSLFSKSGAASMVSTSGGTFNAAARGPIHEPGRRKHLAGSTLIASCAGARYDGTRRTMFTKLCTIVVLALALSPFTAPFSTCDSPLRSSTALIDDDDPGSLVAPLTTETGRLRIVPDVGILLVSHFLAAPPVFRTESVRRSSVVGERSELPTILRL